MTIEILKNSLRFILLILLQVIIVQNINLGAYIILFPYVLFILMLPFETAKHLVLVLAFFTGVCVDYFYDTSGIHTAACTLIGFVRPYVLEYIAPRDGYDMGVQPSIRDMGLEWFLRYAGTLVILHHLAVFYLEVFRFSDFFSTFFRVLLSSIGTFAFIVSLQYIFQSRTSKT